jgi:hypothetical protein
VGRPDGQWLSAEARERLARAVHAAYRRDQAERKPPDDPAMAEWDRLPEHLRESNRKQVDHILEKLRTIGCTVHESGEDGAPPFRFTDEEVELLSRMEHDRWTAERLVDGWRSGPTRDVVDKVHPDLVSWEELSEEVREWDREPVRRIPELLATVGLEVRRDPYHSSSRPP